MDAGHHAGGVEDVEGIVAQMKATPGNPERRAVRRRQERVRQIMHTLPANAQAAIQESLDGDGLVADFDSATEELETIKVRDWSTP